MKDKFVRKYMKLAKVMADDQNPCFSRRVGAVVVDPLTNGIVGAGYNGPPENTPHCNDIEFLKYFFWPQLTRKEKTKLYTYFHTDDQWDALTESLPAPKQNYVLVNTPNGMPSINFPFQLKAYLCFVGVEYRVYNALALLLMPVYRKYIVLKKWIIT